MGLGQDWEASGSVPPQMFPCVLCGSLCLHPHSQNISESCTKPRTSQLLLFLTPWAARGLVGLAGAVPAGLPLADCSPSLQRRSTSQSLSPRWTSWPTAAPPR